MKFETKNDIVIRDANVEITLNVVIFNIVSVPETYDTTRTDHDKAFFEWSLPTVRRHDFRV